MFTQITIENYCQALLEVLNDAEFKLENILSYESENLTADIIIGM